MGDQGDLGDLRAGQQPSHRLSFMNDKPKTIEYGRSENQVSGLPVSRDVAAGGVTGCNRGVTGPRKRSSRVLRYLCECVTGVTGVTGSKSGYMDIIIIVYNERTMKS